MDGMGLDGMKWDRDGIGWGEWSVRSGMGWDGMRGGRSGM